MIEAASSPEPDAGSARGTSLSERIEAARRALERWQRAQEATVEAPAQQDLLA